MTLPRLSSEGIKMSQQTQRPKLRTGSEKKQRHARRTALIGIHNCSGEYKVAMASLKKEKKIWSGLSTRRCKLRSSCLFHYCTDLSSDAKSPDEVVKQILAIHAVLPGQKPEQKFDIPVRTNTHQNAQPTEPSAPQPPVQLDTHHPAQPVQPAQVPPQHEPTPFQPLQSQEPQQPQQVLQSQEPVGPPSNLDGAANLEPDRSLSKNRTSHPSIIPMETNTGTQELPPDMKKKIDVELPPSTLLHSNPKKEARRDDLLRRKDSETQEDDEFHDAQS